MEIQKQKLKLEVNTLLLHYFRDIMHIDEEFQQKEFITNVIGIIYNVILIDRLDPSTQYCLDKLSKYGLKTIEKLVEILDENEKEELIKKIIKYVKIEQSIFKLKDANKYLI
ncbi:MAG: hypothetical protein IJ848_03005 [Alphaproteobacteria bacterium]|nr:hypothetical protein [Alphaproteobacteria bacterium]